MVNGVGTELTGLFEGLITGTENFNDALRNTLLSLSRLLLQAGISGLAGTDGRGVFSILSGSFGGARANGGPVSSGSTYLVGERGPELFTPGRSGMITPNGAGGGVTVINNINVEKGTSTTSVSGGGDAAAAQRLAKLMEATTMQVINREKRPGGALS